MKNESDVFEKILESLRKIEKEILSETLKESDEYDKILSSNWYRDATNRMKERIKSGEYPIDVINDLAREYSSITDGSYDSFAFARDALDRRAWELGLRYTHDPIYSKISYHGGTITSKVTEREKNKRNENKRNC